MWSPGLIYLSVKVESSGVTYNSRELSLTCIAAPVGTPTPAPSGNVVVFRIPVGTNNGPWNTVATTVNVKIGQTLQIINDDVVAHRLHTGGAPCGHQPSATPPGGTFNCVVTRAVNAAAGATYDHTFGTKARFYVNATN